jgi:hypothetical protein
MMKLKNCGLLSVLLATLFSLCTPAQAQVSSVETNLLNYYSNWSFSAFSLATASGKDSQDGGGSLFTFNYVSAHYRLDYNTRLAFRVPFTYRTAGFDDFNGNENQPQQLKIDDLIIDYTNFNLGLLPGEISVYWNLRTSLPTSSVSNAQRKIADFRNEFIFSKALAPRVDLEYWPKFTWFAQTQASYLNDFGTISNTKIYQLDHRITLYYRADQRINVGWFIGGEDSWYNKSKVNSTSRQRDGRLAEHALKMGPALKYTAGRNLNLILNISNVVPLWGFSDQDRGKLGDLGSFHANQTEVALLSFLSF